MAYGGYNHTIFIYLYLYFFCSLHKPTYVPYDKGVDLGNSSMRKERDNIIIFAKKFASYYRLFVVKPYEINDHTFF